MSLHYLIFVVVTLPIIHIIGHIFQNCGTRLPIPSSFVKGEVSGNRLGAKGQSPFPENGRISLFPLSCPRRRYHSLSCRIPFYRWAKSTEQVLLLRPFYK